MPHASMKTDQVLLLTTFDQRSLSLADVLIRELTKKGVRATHPSKLSPEQPLSDGIRTLVEVSTAVIADISIPNPNLLLEVGMAQGLRRPVIFIAAEDAELPFEISSHRVFRYKTDQPDHMNLVSAILSELGKSISIGTERPKELGIGKVETIGRQPFSFMAAEAIPNAEILVSVFVPPRWYKSACGPSHTVLTGARGSGKTMVLHAMRARHANTLGIEGGVAGAYLNFNTVSHYVGAESRILANPELYLKYINLLLTSQMIQEVDVLLVGGEISAEEETALAYWFQEATGKSQLKSLADVEAEVNRETIALRPLLGRSFVPASSDPFCSVNFPEEFAGILSSRMRFFRQHTPAFLVDDYASDTIDPDTRRLLHKMFFRRSATHCFKLSTIAGRSRFDITESQIVEALHDYVHISTDAEAFASPEHEYRSMLTEILNRRLVLSGIEHRAEELFGASTTTDIEPDYSGIPGLYALCGSNIRLLLDLCRRIVDEIDVFDLPIPAAIQNRVVVNMSRRLADEVSKMYEWSDFVGTFLHSTLAFLYRLSKLGKNEESRKHLLFRDIEIFQGQTGMSDSIVEKLDLLIRGGVLQPKKTRTPTSAKDRIVLRINCIYFPAFHLPIFPARNHLTLSEADLVGLLEDPSKFWREWLIRVDSSSSHLNLWKA